MQLCFRSFGVFVLLVLIIHLQAQDKRPMTFQDFFGLQRLGAVNVSPDGQRIAYTLTVPDISNNSLKTDIWILDLKSLKTVKFSTATKSSSGPVWSPDGKDIYFNHDGQIWKKALAGGDAVQVTAFAPGAAGVVFNRSGTQMLFSAKIYPDCPDEECNQKRKEEADSSKVKARIIDRLLYRHWNRWLEGKRSHIFMADANGQNIKDMTPGDYDAPPLALGGDLDYTFSADGKEICFVRNTDEIVAASTNNDLFIVSPAEGKISRLTENTANDNNPVYSPDGKYIAYASMVRPGFEADKQRLMLHDRIKNTFDDLTENFTLSVESIIWHPEGKEIYFTASEMGTISLYKVNIRKGKPEAVLKGHYLSAVQFLTENELIFKKQTAAMPEEIFRMNLKNGKIDQLSHINSDLLAQLQLSELEPFQFSGAHGHTVYGYILKPPFFNPEKKYATVQLIHGGPQGFWGDEFHYRWNYQMFAAPGYVLYMINFHGSRGYGQDFMDAVSKDWGGSAYEDIKLGTEYVIKNYAYVDADRLGAAGASYGGFMINWIAGDPNHPYQCLVSHDGVYEQVSMYGATEELWFPEWEFNGTPWDEGSLYQHWSPANRAQHFRTPTLVIHGEHDYRVPYTQGLQLFTALQRQGVPSRLLFFPDEDHFVQKPQNAQLWWKTVQDWFERYLPK